MDRAREDREDEGGLTTPPCDPADVGAKAQLCKPDMVYKLNRAHGLHIIGYLDASDEQD